jgi:hypothetical protein
MYLDLDSDLSLFSILAIGRVVDAAMCRSLQFELDTVATNKQALRMCLLGVGNLWELRMCLLGVGNLWELRGRA